MNVVLVYNQGCVHVDNVCCVCLFARFDYLFLLSIETAKISVNLVTFLA